MHQCQESKKQSISFTPKEKGLQQTCITSRLPALRMSVPWSVATAAVREDEARALAACLNLTESFWLPSTALIAARSLPHRSRTSACVILPVRAPAVQRV